MKVTVIQMNSNASKEDNVKQAEQLVRDAALADGADLIALPEMFACLSGNPTVQHDSAESVPDGQTAKRFSALAKELGVYIHMGSLVEIDSGKYYNTTVVFNNHGEMIAKYRKIHLFDIVLPDGTEIFESKAITRGEDIATYQCENLTVGCSICYDLRFPELYRKLKDLGSELIFAPAAFTFQTGAAHWELLLRSRAIDTQCYVLAPAQVHSFDDGKYMNYGHAMIVDPWGQVVAQATNKIGWVTGEIDIDWLKDVRARLPLKNHHVIGVN